MTDEKYQDIVQEFISKLGVDRCYGMLQLKNGSTMMLDYNTTDTERAGMMYQMKKIVDTDFVKKAILFRENQQKQQTVAPSGTPEESPV